MAGMVQKKNLPEKLKIYKESQRSSSKGEAGRMSLLPNLSIIA
jgi:hypothetical protein